MKFLYVWKTVFFFTKRRHNFSRKKSTDWILNMLFVLSVWQATSKNLPWGLACCFCFFADVWSLSVGQENKNRGFSAGEGEGAFFKKSGHFQNSLRYIRGRRGLCPAAGRVWVFSRGESLAMGGVWIFSRGLRPVGGGARIFSRGEGPAGGGAEKIYPEQGPAGGGVGVISRGLRPARAYPGPRKSLNLSQLQ